MSSDRWRRRERAKVCLRPAERGEGQGEGSPLLLRRSFPSPAVLTAGRPLPAKRGEAHALIITSCRARSRRAARARRARRTSTSITQEILISDGGDQVDVDVLLARGSRTSSAPRPRASACRRRRSTPSTGSPRS